MARRLALPFLLALIVCAAAISGKQLRGRLRRLKCLLQHAAGFVAPQTLSPAQSIALDLGFLGSPILRGGQNIGRYCSFPQLPD